MNNTINKYSGNQQFGKLGRYLEIVVKCLFHRLNSFFYLNMFRERPL